jgi:probable phosphoglycerate mutase
MARNEARGLDFRPAGGESPREVRERLSRWLSELAPEGVPVLAMTHKGVIRAALSLATDWDMKSDFRPRPVWGGAHVFRHDGSGSFALQRLNVSLEPVHG